MPIDPQVAAHYAARPAATKASGAMTIQDIRRSADALYNDKNPHPAVFSVRDAEIPCAGHSVPLRLYFPGNRGPYPVLLYYHGGGFCMHNIASHDSLCRQLCLTSGAVVVNVGYRLAPENPFPAAVEDAFTALLWIHANAERFGIDPLKIAVAGDSAGANLSAAVSLLSRDFGGPAVGLQLLAYGSYGCFDGESDSMRRLKDDNPVLSGGFLKMTDGFYTGAADRTNPYRFPGRAADLSGQGRICLFNAEYDPLLDDGVEYGKRCAAAGNDVFSEIVPGMYHGFLLLWDKFDRSRSVTERMGALLRETFDVR